MTSRISADTDLGQARLARIRQLLKKKPRATVDVAQTLSINKATIKLYFRILRDEIHVSSWQRRGTNWVPVYSLGAGEDALCPATRASHTPKPLAAYVPPSFAQQAVFEKDPEDWFDNRARRLAAETQPYRHPMTAMLFGAYQPAGQGAAA